MKNLLFLLTLTMLFSCKDDDKIKPDTLNITSCETVELFNKKCRLTETKYLGNPNPIDTTFSTYIYSGNRIDSVKIKSYYQLDLTHEFHYNSKDQLSFVNNTNSFSMNMGMYKAKSFVYNKFNRLIEVTSYDYNIDSTNIKFQYTNCKLSQAVITYSNSIVEKFSILENSSGNIVQYEMIETNDSTNKNSPKIVLEYDDKNNPYQYISKREFDIFFYFSRFDIFSYFSKNNITKSTVYRNGVINSTESFQIDYNEQDYPIQIISDRRDITLLKYDCD